MDVRVGLWRQLSAEELMLLNCGVGETLESPLDCKEIQPVHPKGDQSWVFIGRTDAQAETAVLWPPDARNWLIGKDPDSGRDWGQEEKGMTENEMAGWHHWLDGRESEWTPGVGDGQGGLACCDSWDRKESDTTERLNSSFESHSISENTARIRCHSPWVFHCLNTEQAIQLPPQSTKYHFVLAADGWDFPGKYWIYKLCFPEKSQTL